jgi:hypothetical protein
MARASARVRNPSGHAGLIDNAIGLISALFAYVETRRDFSKLDSLSAVVCTLTIKPISYVHHAIEKSRVE